jgi:hypothetical protein
VASVGDNTERLNRALADVKDHENSPGVITGIPHPVGGR